MTVVVRSAEEDAALIGQQRFLLGRAQHERARRDIVIVPHPEQLEDYEPDPKDERSAEEYLLERAAIARARSEREIVDAITRARGKGVSWQRIGTILGTSAQAAQQRYGPVVESA